MEVRNVDRTAVWRTRGYRITDWTRAHMRRDSVSPTLPSGRRSASDGAGLFRSACGCSNWTVALLTEAARHYRRQAAEKLSGGF